MSQDPKFVMNGAREAVDLGFNIKQEIEGIENAFDRENYGLVFDLAKTIIESTCKHILSKSGVQYESSWDMPKLFKNTLSVLKLVPPHVTNQENALESTRKLTGQLQALVQSISELRNKYGFASHGKDPEFQGLEKIHALLAARATDAVVHFLCTIHRFPFSEPEKPLEYNDNPMFNEYIDDENGGYVHIKVLEDVLEYRPSEVLFYLDPKAYESYLQAFIELNNEE